MLSLVTVPMERTQQPLFNSAYAYALGQPVALMNTLTWVSADEYAKGIDSETGICSYTKGALPRVT